MLYSLFSTDLLIGYLRIFPVEMGGSQIYKGTDSMGGVVSCVRLPTIGRGVKFCHFGAYLLIE